MAKSGTSLMFVGSESSVKFYMKGPEFYQHDFKRIRNFSVDTALELLDKARGVLRFEVTLRHKAIQQIFGVHKNSINIFPLLTRDTIIDIMRGHIHKVLGITVATPMNTQTAYDKISAHCNPTTAIRLYSFYRLYVSSDPTDRSVLLGYPRSTRARYLSTIRRYRLGLPVDISDSEVSFTIPSTINVGEFSPVSNTGATSHF
jgi:hypothetical protein